MTLVPRDPFGAMYPLREAMNRLFEESFIPSRFEFFAGHVIPIDVKETDDKQKYVVEASLPGIKSEELQITAEDDTLSIRVVRKEEKEEKEKGSYVRRERYEGELSRTISLPTRIDADKVEATYEHGVLTLYIPKSESVKPKQISVKVKELAGKR